jgi:hypothetical protein
MSSNIARFWGIKLGTFFSFILLTLAFSSATTNDVKAQNSLPEIQQPTYEIGSKTTWLRDGDKETWTVTDVSAETTSWERSTGCKWTSLNSGLAPSSKFENCGTRGPSKGTNEVELTKGALYPIKLKNKFSYSYVGSNDRGNNWSDDKRCKINETENITVQGTAYETYVVECNDRWNERYYYFAPSVVGPMKLVRVVRDHIRRGRSILEQVIEKPTPKKIEQPQGSPLEEYKTKCSGLGFTAGTEKFGDCVMKLMK